MIAQKSAQDTRLTGCSAIDARNRSSGVIMSRNVTPLVRSANASQIDGVPAYKAPAVDEAPWTRPEASEIIFRNSGAVVRIGGDRAFYSPSTDHIQLPPDFAFNGPEEFAATALHELAHWTGHPSRLNMNIPASASL